MRSTARLHSQKEMTAALRLIAGGAIRVARLVTGHLPLPRVGKPLQLAMSRPHLKVVLEPQEADR
jgi:threonine dehydrogenase-like Zn-dependent dehydrogenase